MAHDVFISYASRDKLIADAVGATLEGQRIRCWIAPRDVMPGMAYGEALIEALNLSRIMVLVYSSNSNNSPQVLREMERAVSKGITIIPFRIEDVPLSKAMEYFISAQHWLDALTPPLEKHIQSLAATVKILLARQTDSVPGQPAGTPLAGGNPAVEHRGGSPAFRAEPPGGRFPALKLLGVAAVLVGVGAGAYLFVQVGRDRGRATPDGTGQRARAGDTHGSPPATNPTELSAQRTSEPPPPTSTNDRGPLQFAVAPAVQGGEAAKSTGPSPSAASELQQIIAGAEADRELTGDPVKFERWRSRVLSRLNALFDLTVANRFSDATYAYDTGYTASIRLANGLGFLEGLVLLKNPLENRAPAEVQSQLARFVDEAEAIPDYRTNEIAFTRWTHKVEAYLTCAVNQQAGVKFRNATYPGRGTLPERIGGALGTVDSMITRSEKR